MNSLKKIIILYCFFSFMLVLFFSPQKVHAQFGIVHDPGNAAILSGILGTTGLAAGNSVALFSKEYFLDLVENLLVRAVIHRMVASTVNWINSGFQGKPAYVTNPEKFFSNIGKGVAGQVIYDNPNFRFMCAPFKAKVQIAINRAYNQPFNGFQCSLDSVVRNYDNFMQDFDQGGWEGFLAVTQNPQNNPIGLYTTWQDDLTRRTQAEISKAQTELDQGSGFLSYKKCAGTTVHDNATGKDSCIGAMETVTPGSVISTKLNNVLGLDNEALVTADEINELVGALVGQLTSKLLNLGLGALSGSGPEDKNSYTYDIVNGPDGAEALNQRAKNLGDELANQTFPCITTSGKIGTSPNTNGVPCTDVSTTVSTNSTFTPITASDGSIITGMPNDPDCSSASFDEIVQRAGQIYYYGNQSSVGSIANIVKNMNCSPTGALP